MVEDSNSVNASEETASETVLQPSEQLPEKAPSESVVTKPLLGLKDIVPLGVMDKKSTDMGRIMHQVGRILDSVLTHTPLDGVTTDDLRVYAAYISQADADLIPMMDLTQYMKGIPEGPSELHRLGLIPGKVRILSTVMILAHEMIKRGLL